MSSRIKCFYLEETKQKNIHLRVYDSEGICSLAMGYHNASIIHSQTESETLPDIPKSYSKWLTHCECGHGFTSSAKKVTSMHPIYRRTDTGELLELRDAPAGAMWDAGWYPWKGSDKKSLTVRTPGGDWCIDSIGSNCTKPEDKKHKCWVRHGIPPEITVDKNGNTCAAGAGSIVIGKYHGFLRNGYLEQC